MKKYFFQPIHPFILTQRFGENKACVDTATGKKVITCDGNNPPSGYRSLYGLKGHQGLDLVATHGQLVYAAQDGIVAAIDTNPKTGLDVKIETSYDGRDFRHIYEHLLGYQVKKGDKVRVGDLVGWADNTGYSSGNHLHFQLEEKLNGKWVPIDPLPLMEYTFALKWAGLERQVRDLIARVAEFIADRMHK